MLLTELFLNLLSFLISPFYSIGRVWMCSGEPPVNGFTFIFVSIFNFSFFIILLFFIYWGGIFTIGGPGFLSGTITSTTLFILPPYLILNTFFLLFFVYVTIIYYILKLVKYFFKKSLKKFFIAFTQTTKSLFIPPEELPYVKILITIQLLFKPLLPPILRILLQRHIKNMINLLI